ncbi:hypothetical protein CcCBS67573_g05190 [Chytriomyces confervae]|uniref:CNNM transmembrane domain-containing protein n=1 Tax=Chytriomyces confervae TaxID=246404 RepID=A0A507FB96_9FUNG|nr:hypothetical protein CcCBS67573_g05190 [Chytriomyces confervae]
MAGHAFRASPAVVLTRFALAASVIVLVLWSTLNHTHRGMRIQPHTATLSTDACVCSCPSVSSFQSVLSSESKHPLSQLDYSSEPVEGPRQSAANKTGKGPGKKPKKEPMDAFTYWTYLGMIFLLVLVGGMFAGLTIGLMSIDETNLKILKVSGTPTEKMYAERIEPIRKNGHLLLVSLLLGNTIVNETLPILFSGVGLEGHQAVLFSTALILVFGEIIPQAVCARYGLLIGATFAWPVRILIWIVFVIAYPIAKLLDWVLGHKDGVIYRRAELKELIAMHDEDNRGPLNHEEVSILRAVLELRGKTAETVMTKLVDVFMLPLTSKFDRKTLNTLMEAGHSRVPVYNKSRSDIIGVILIKHLIALDPEEGVSVSKTSIGRLPRIKKDTPLFEILHVFEEGRSHMAVVVDELPLDEDSVPNSLVTASPLLFSSPRTTTHRRFVTLGIITLEDVIEELIGQEIVDETDVYVDVNTKVKVGRVLDIIFSREGSSLSSSLIIDTDGDDTMHVTATESRPLLTDSIVTSPCYGATTSQSKACHTSPVTQHLTTPRLRATRKFRENLVPADVILKEITSGELAPVFGFEDGQRVLIRENGDVEADVPHLTLDQSFASQASSSMSSTHNLETLD